MEVAESKVLRALRALIADPYKAEELFEARVRDHVVLVADWFILGVAVLGVGVEDMFEQLPSFLGRQLEHCLLAFIHAHPLHKPVQLHLQHSTISPRNPFEQINLPSRIYCTETSHTAQTGLNTRNDFICWYIECVTSHK